MKLIGEYVVIALLVALSLGRSVATDAATPPRAATVLADVKTQGAPAVVAKLWADNARWNQVMANIGQGSHEWLQVAAGLRPGTDAGASEALDEAIFLALKHAPVTVLRLLKDGTFETSTVCSSNIGADYTATQSRHFIKERIRVLDKMSDPAIEPARAQCLAALRTALADFSEQKTPL